MMDRRRANTGTRRTGKGRQRGSGDRRQPPAAVIGRAPITEGPRIEITPSKTEYERLCRDLKKLRHLGATSNTEAIIDAVRDAAARGKVEGRPHKASGKRSPAPRSGNRKGGS
jgi:hypothetical protein